MFELALSMSGSASWAVSASCAIPMVATSTITRGARNNRVITVASTAAANSPPAATATTAAAQKFQWYWSTSSASSAAQSAPIAPTAKLITRLDR